MLPLYGGYLLALVTRRRQTIADLLCRTVVVRTEPVRVGGVLPALAVAVTVLLLAGGLTADVRNDPPLLAVSQALVEPATTSATTSGTTGSTRTAPAAPAPVGPLPPGDLLGRIAPAAAGFEVVPDEDSGLGPLTVEQAAALGSDTKDVAAQAGYVALGYQGGYGRGFTGTSYGYVVVVLRLKDAAAVEVVLKNARAEKGAHAGSVPGSVVSPAATNDGVTTVACLFGHGDDLYEVDVFGPPSKADEATLDVRVRAQYAHSLLTG